MITWWFPLLPQDTLSSTQLPHAWKQNNTLLEQACCLDDGFLASKTLLWSHHSFLEQNHNNLQCDNDLVTGYEVAVLVKICGILPSHYRLTCQCCEYASVRINKELLDTVGVYIIRISIEVIATYDERGEVTFKICFCIVDNGGESTGVQYAKKPPSNVIRDKIISEMHKSDTRVTR